MKQVCSLWKGSLIRDSMSEDIDEHIIEKEKSIIALLCDGDLLELLPEIQTQCL